ncbi:hypothetical protein CEXT_8531 [Caerostris extrusa]|uniref:Uncharacterized protein n=1 Tax=Caerostris extrusa TaxID=172846 RepID=A0AAV4PXV0_CAEEX|nr:hypothetical protein CEXT_8531 [Caerostris extrusa]
MYDMKRRTLNDIQQSHQDQIRNRVRSCASILAHTQDRRTFVTHGQWCRSGFHAKPQAQNAPAPTYLFVCRSSDESRVFDLRNARP